MVTGPPGSGKSTWVAQEARPGDLVWDLDVVAAVIGNCGEEIPREQHGSLPWPIMKACLVMLDALVAWLAETELSVRVYLIISDAAQARALARQLVAQLIQLPESRHGRQQAGRMIG